MNASAGLSDMRIHYSFPSLTHVSVLKKPVQYKLLPLGTVGSATIIVVSMHPYYGTHAC